MSKREIELIYTVSKELKSELIESFIADNNHLDFVVDALKDLSEE